MAMKSANDSIVTVFGGSGFLGRHVVRVLANRGYRIRVAVRRPELAGFLRPLGVVGQIEPVQANIRFAQSVAAQMDCGCATSAGNRELSARRIAISVLCL